MGVQSRKGCGVTIKHFACNNQEDNRMGVDACVSERALREIYFRGFEIAIKESNPVAIMSSYNLINGVHAANSRDLCTVLAREEWGFDGVIMSDWNTTVPEDGSIPWNVQPQEMTLLCREMQKMTKISGKLMQKDCCQNRPFGNVPAGYCI